MTFILSFALIIGALLQVIPWYVPLISMLIEYLISTANDQMQRNHSLKETKEQTRAIGFMSNGDSKEE